MLFPAIFNLKDSRRLCQLLKKQTFLSMLLVSIIISVMGQTLVKLWHMAKMISKILSAVYSNIKSNKVVIIFLSLNGQKIE